MRHSTFFRGPSGWASPLLLMILMLLALVLGASHAQAQSTTTRSFPSNATIGVLKASYWPTEPWLVIGKQTLRVAPGFVARGTLNEHLSSFPASASGKPYAIAWTPDTMGQVLRVWVLRPAEIASFLSAARASAALAASTTSSTTQ